MPSSRSLTSRRYRAPRTQPLQQLFAGASNFSISGSQINAIVERLLAQLRQGEFAYRSISQHVGYSSANGLTIIDALDERFVLPLSIVSKFEDVHEALLKHFRGVVGEGLVAEKKYRIARQHDGQLVKPEDWKRVLEAGEVVVMSMLIEKVWVRSVEDACPKCGRTRLGSYRDGGWLKCRRCKMRYLCSTKPVGYRGQVPRSPYEIGSFRHVAKERVNVSRTSVFPWKRTLRSLTVPCSCSPVRSGRSGSCPNRGRIKI
ncbi:hypothetical protein DFP72DRAFT_611455 [Ephemerocybe angulata]|uniref:Ubiquitin-like domain-containing protein n=1 Tax=Ephemerocybe angulata TaxID=980116 RepID=A0A8H6HKC3_9AGAR|nr:hypothetical protein DFP72DRAFT_611455 [Tulosesus angulatus]